MFCVIEQGFDRAASQDVKDILLVKALLASRSILLEELQKISKGVGEPVDILEFMSKMNHKNILKFMVHANQYAMIEEVLGQGKPQNGLEVLSFISCFIVLLFIFLTFISFLLFH